MIFYTQLFAFKRGTLAKIWLAAHWERKLTKAHIFECNLETTIRDIISPKMEVGLRTSGHLLLGVVRIYSRKAKYLLADCSDALLRIKTAFRPDQTDMPLDEFEAARKTITLNEDFTAFDLQLPEPSDIDVVDHFSLNQSRSEEITLREDFGNGFLNLVDFGNESQRHPTGLLDMSFLSGTQQGDAFGDEDKGFDLLDFLTLSSEQESTDLIPEERQNENQELPTLSHQQDAENMEVETPTMSETTLLANEEKAFALEPVAFTPNSTRTRERRKRKLVVDPTKELSDDLIRDQLSDYSDLVAPLDMAPPTAQLMHWKENGGVDKLFVQPCSTVVAPQIQEIFAKCCVQVHGVCEEAEVMRQDGQEVQGEISAVTTDNVSVVDSSVDAERTYDTGLTVLDHRNDSRLERSAELTQGENRSEFTHPELPSEDSMFVQQSVMEQSTSLHSQSLLDSQDFEDQRIFRRTQRLLAVLKTHDTTSSLGALCKGCTRWQTATTFFCLLVLRKENTVHLQQSSPYNDIFITPGPKFSEH